MVKMGLDATPGTGQKISVKSKHGATKVSFSFFFFPHGCI